MGRWEPDARGRMTRAALELYAERGFEQTTVADIADRAGVTERTFFRHFADKREVLFDGSSELERLVLDTVAAAPEDGAPLDVAGEAMATGAAALEERREFAEKRAGVVAGHPSLQERELLKLARLAASIAAALHERGVAEPMARLAGHCAVTAFSVGFERWIAGDASTTLADETRAALRDLKALTA